MANASNSAATDAAGNSRREQLKRMSRMDAIYEFGTPVTMTDFKQALYTFYQVEEARRWPIWLIGESGVGKNDGIEQSVTELSVKLAKKMNFLWFPCKGVAPEDLRGMPALVRQLNQNGYDRDIAGLVSMLHDYYASEPTYKFQILKYLEPAFTPGWAGIIHLDEYPQASKEVQQMIYMLMYDRRIDDRKISDEAMIVVSMNPPSVSEYMLSRIQKAAQDRPVIFRLEPEFGEWLTWAEKVHVHPLVLGFARDYPMVYSVNKGRALKRLSDMITSIDQVHPTLLGDKSTPAFVRATISGCIDIEHAENFVRYMHEVYEISGVAIMRGDKEQTKRAKQMLKGGDKAVRLHRIHNEMHEVMKNPSSYAKDVFQDRSADFTKEETWREPLQRAIDYMKLLQDNDMDALMGFIRGLEGVSTTEHGKLGRAFLNKFMIEKENKALYKEVARCLAEISRPSNGQSDQQQALKTQSAV